MDNKIKTKTLNKLQTFRQRTWNFHNFINKFKRLILKAKKILNNKIKKALYEKILKKELILVFINIDNNTNFKAYRTQLIAIDDRLTQYKFNFNKIVYSAILKIKYSDPVLKSIEDNIIKWETIIIVSKPRNQKTYKNQKKKK